MIPRAFWHYLAALYFALQSLGAIGWWLALLLEPRLRLLFRPSNVPDAALLSFWLPDALLFIGAAIWTSALLIVNPNRVQFPLALHLGGSVYAALYCIAQTLMTGEAKTAAMVLSFCALCGAFFGWKAAFSGD